MKKLSAILILAIITPYISFFIPTTITNAATTPPKTQTITKEALGVDTDEYPGGVYWTQKDNGDFHAAYPRNGGMQDFTTSPESSRGDTYPKRDPSRTQMTFDMDVSSTKPDSWKFDGATIDVNLIINQDVYKADWGDTSNFTPVGDPIPLGNQMVRITTITGGSNYFRTFIYTGSKWQTLYHVPVEVYWKGEVTEKKEIDVNPDSSMTVGQTKQLNASVRTKEFTSASFGSYVSVRSDPETTWESSDRSIVDFSPKGLITAKKAGIATIRATWTKDGYEISDTATITVTATPCTGIDCGSGPSEPPTYTITGDFDIIPNQIEFRDSFAIKPKNFVIPAECTYQNHRYVIRRDGDSSLSDYVTSKTQTTSYAYSNYPNVISVGMHEVAIKITAICAGQTIETDWEKPKSLIVTGLSDNSPPVFTAGFFEEPDLYSFDPLTEVVVNHKVNLRIINDPLNEPDTPYDPDGDPISYIWDFAGSSSSWVRSFPSEYGAYTNDESIRWIIADKLGLHCVKVTARDPYGGASTQNVCIYVVAENPVPIIDAPKEVVEGRPLASPISGSRSYSPMKRPITDYIWTNKQDKYMTPGNELITLDVADSTGLKSLAPASHNLTVKPDLPPVPRLDFVPHAVRNVDVQFTNTSYSPDNDQIVINTVTYRYDSDNDGDFAEETSWPIMTEDKTFTFKPTKIGKYAFNVYVKEDWGKTATQDFILDVLNDNPSATFTVKGEIEQPSMDPLVPVTATELVSSAWNTFNKDGQIPKAWYAVGNTLQNGVWNGFPQIRSVPSTHNVPYNNVTTRNLTDGEVLKEIAGDDISIEPDATNKRYLVKRNEVTVRVIDVSGSWYTGQFKWLVNHNTISFYRSDHHNGGCSNNGYTNGSWASHYLTLPTNKLTDPATKPTVTYICGYDSLQSERSSLTSYFVKIEGLFSMTPTSSGKYSISKKVGNNIVWTVTEDTKDAIYFHSDQKALPVSSDLRKMAHLNLGNVIISREGNPDYIEQYLTIRNADTGAIVKRVSLGIIKNDLWSGSPNKASIIGWYKDIIIIKMDTKVYGYNYDGNIVWQTSGSNLGYAYYHSNPQLSISKDGYIPAISATKNTWNNYSINLNYFNVLTGMIDKSTLVSTYSMISSTDFDMVNFNFEPLYLLGDGKISVFYTAVEYKNNNSSYNNGGRRFSIVVEGTPKSTSPTDPIPTFGQLRNPTKVMDAGEITYSLMLNDTRLYRTSENAGFSFRIQASGKTMYRVESDRHRTSLVSIKDGVRTVIKTSNFPINEDSWYTFKVRFIGDRIKVYASGIPIIEAQNSDIATAGTFGFYSTKEDVAFKDLAVLMYGHDLMSNVAIVDSSLQYSTTFNDPENDPQAKPLTTWTIAHTNPNMFLDAGDGKSGLSATHNKTYASPVLSFDRVGLFKVDYQGTDDPHPSYLYPSNVFGSYRQLSDKYAENITVHRRPINDFMLSISQFDHTVVWTELGYDPDRWLSSTYYSTEATGIDYKTTRGILERQYYYIDPNGNLVDQKLVAPPLAGDYIVAETVRDEYGSWSEWVEKPITIITPVINKPPAADITMPTSTDQNNPTTFTTLRPSFAWTYFDEDGDPQSQYEMRIMRYGGTFLLSSGIRTGAATSWTPSSDLPAGTNLFVQVRVNDGMEWSNWSAPKFFSINRPPISDFDWSPKPVYEGDMVQFSTTVSDPDNDALAVGYEITSPNGTKQAYSYTFYSPYSTHAGPSIRMQTAGTWTIKMTINDAKAPAVIVTKIVSVEALAVKGSVKHTEAWESNRLAYNEKRDPDRPSGTFWAGEAFVLEATATDTGASGTKAASVTVRVFGEQSKALGSTDAAKTKWSALLRSADTDIDFNQLTDGNYTFVFTATYTNGTVKTDAVTITIDESVEAYATVHRLH